MDFQLADKTAVVTGAGRGIGLAVTKALTKEGVREVGAARTITPELNTVAALAVSADLSTAREPRPSPRRQYRNWAASTSSSTTSAPATPTVLASPASSTPTMSSGAACSTSTCSARSGQPARRCPACSTGAAPS